MKSAPLVPSRIDAPEVEAQRTSRRRLVVGAGVAAGAAVAAAALHRQADDVPAAASADAAPEAAQGYRLTDHIRRYYDTTRS